MSIRVNVCQWRTWLINTFYWSLNRDIDLWKAAPLWLSRDYLLIQSFPTYTCGLSIDVIFLCRKILYKTFCSFLLFLCDFFLQIIIMSAAVPCLGPVRTSQLMAVLFLLIRTQLSPYLNWNGKRNIVHLTAVIFLKEKNYFWYDIRYLTSQRTLFLHLLTSISPVADPGGPRGPWPPPGPVKISHKKKATEGTCIDFMFLGPPPTRPLDLLLISLT